MPDDPRERPAARARRGARLQTKPFAADSGRLREELQRELRKTVAPSLAVILGPDVGARIVLHGVDRDGAGSRVRAAAARRERLVAARPRRRSRVRRVGDRRPREHQRHDPQRPAVRRGDPQAWRPHLHRQDGHRDAEGCRARRAGGRARAPPLDRRSQRALGSPAVRRAARVERRRGARRAPCRRSASSSWTWTGSRRSTTRTATRSGRSSIGETGRVLGARHRIARLRHALRWRRVRGGVSCALQGGRDRDRRGDARGGGRARLRASRRAPAPGPELRGGDRPGRRPGREGRSSRLPTRPCTARSEPARTASPSRSREKRTLN